MTAESSQPPIAWLLLGQLDGRLLCISLVDGEKQWCTQLPGGPLIRSGRRNGTSAESQMCAQRSYHSSCGGCHVNTCNQVSNGDKLSLVDVKVVEPAYSLVFSAEGGRVTSCIVSHPHQGRAMTACPPLECCFSTALAMGEEEKEEERLPLDVALKRWSDRCCPLHRPVDLEHMETSYAELDFSTGRLLLSLDARGASHVAQVDNSSVSAASPVVTVRRTDTSRTIVFPPHWQPLLSDGDPAEKVDACCSWYALGSTIDLDVLDLSTDDSTIELPMEGNFQGLHLEQTLTTAGITARLRADATAAKVFPLEMKMSDSVPVLFAHIVWLQQGTTTTTRRIVLTEDQIKGVITGTDTGDNAEAKGSSADVTISHVRCREIPVMSFSVDQQRNVAWKMQEYDGCGKELPPGFVGYDSCVLFSDRIMPRLETSHTEALPRRLSTTTTRAATSSTSSYHAYDRGVATEEDEENSLDDEGEEAMLLRKEDTNEVESSSSSSSSSSNLFSHDALVLRNGAKPPLSSSSSSNCGGALIPMRMSPSFFDENFDVLLLLGRGASGAVLLTRHRVTGVFYAIKIMLIRGRFSEDTLNEVRLHALLHHKYLVRYYSCWLETVTPCRVHQLASIGLCGRREVQQVHATSTAGRLNCSNHWRDMPDKASCGECWLARANTENAVGQQLLKAPPLLSSSPAATPIPLPLLLPPPPPPKQLQHMEITGTYMVGHDGVDSSTSCSSHGDIAAMDDGLPESSRFSDSSSQESDSILGSQVVFLQLEYCQTTLAERLGSRKRIDRLENIIIMLQLLSALRYVHNCGSLHRDIKPTNVFLDYRSQIASGEDTSEEEEDEEDDDDDMDVKKMGDDMSDCMHATEIAGPELVPLFNTSPISAFELLKASTGVGSLAVYLRRLKTAKSGGMRQRAVRSVRRWLNKRLVQVRLGDFGLGKSLRDQRVDIAIYFDRSAMNTVGVGSPLYSSPEQLDGSVCTPSSDAFACGVMMAEMYLQPKTVAERLTELRRVREGAFPGRSLLKEYPELQVVQGLTVKDPNSRMLLSVAHQVLSKTADDILLSFLLE